jgi:hypothetical protein
VQYGYLDRGTIPSHRRAGEDNQVLLRGRAGPRDGAHVGRLSALQRVAGSNPVSAARLPAGEVWRALEIYGSSVILPKNRDPRFITIRRGGTLTDSDHRLLALWAAACSEHVLPFFESEQPADSRPRQAIEQIRAWTRGEIRMSESRAAGGHAMGAARELSGAARHAAYAAGQAAVVAHVAAHELGAAAYAIKAARAAAPGCEERAGRLECRWQREQLADAIRELVLDDQRLRNEICWSVFGC